jgi:hypothetical protein
LLVTFDAATPNLTTPLAMTGITAGETVKGIDFRPADGVLWAFATNAANTAGALYIINPTTGAASGRVPVISAAGGPALVFDGSSSYSVDFNPVANLLRVVSFLGQNLAVDVATGVGTAGTPYAAFGNATAVAYTNNFVAPVGVTNTTRLFAINQNDDTLNTVTTPGDGTTLTPVGALTILVQEVQSMDIKGGDNGLVLGALRTTSAGPHSLYQINLATGAATAYKAQTPALAQIGGATGAPLVDIAIRR